MDLRCPECRRAQASGTIAPASRIECESCGASFTREQALASWTALARGPRAALAQELFSLDRCRAAAALADPTGVISAVSPHSDADELNTLVDDALFARAIRRARADTCLSVYPLSLADPEPVLAVSPSNGPTLLGWSLKLRQRDGEGPVDFTVRVLAEIVEQANTLAGTYHADSARLDRIASHMNRPGRRSDSDLCEVVATELRESGRELLKGSDEAEPASDWRRRRVDDPTSVSPGIRWGAGYRVVDSSPA